MTAIQFNLGRVVATRGVLQAVQREDIDRALARHAHGDWGDVSDTDGRENERSLREHRRLLSAYEASDGTKFWIITEADRSATTVLLPDEY